MATIAWRLRLRRTLVETQRNDNLRLKFNVQDVNVQVNCQEGTTENKPGGLCPLSSNQSAHFTKITCYLNQQGPHWAQSWSRADIPCVQTFVSQKQTLTFFLSQNDIFRDLAFQHALSHKKTELIELSNVLFVGSFFFSSKLSPCILLHFFC